MNDPLDYSTYSYNELMQLYEVLSRRLAGANSNFFYALFRREIIKIAEELNEVGDTIQRQRKAEQHGA